MSGRRMTAAQVIALARSIGVSATNLKRHLTRMVADGALQRSGPVHRALYWPSRSQAWIVEGILVRLQTVPSEPWDRTWLILMLHMPSNRGAREQLRASLWFGGFRPWVPNAFVRPATEGRPLIHSKYPYR
jgi:DNA-binding transcriptional regulator PaaX